MIFFFSGTGNSKWIAEQLAKRLDDRIISISDAIVNKEFKFTLTEEESVGWVFPTYSWGPAPIVLDFISKMHLYGYSAKSYCYMACTCGDDIGLSVKVWRKALGGILGNAAFSVQMPNNYILLPGFDVDSDAIAQEKLDNAQERLDNIALRITEHFTGEDVVTGNFKWLKTRLIYPIFRKFAMSAKSFKVTTDKCTSCGLCQKNCPTHNIHLNDRGIPYWDNNCAMCLRCIHSCPTRAIEYGSQSQSKGRYKLRKYIK
ncbi:MAG: EFR1 family ferrodoxin [Muribaculaceae bacterium]